MDRSRASWLLRAWAAAATIHPRCSSPPARLAPPLLCPLASERSPRSTTARSQIRDRSLQWCSVRCASSLPAGRLSFSLLRALAWLRPACWPSPCSTHSPGSLAACSRRRAALAAAGPLRRLLDLPASFLDLDAILGILPAILPSCQKRPDNTFDKFAK